MKNVEKHNLAPPYLTAKEALPPEVMSTLIDLVVEKGTKSKWSYNPDCREYQIANPFSPEQNKPDPNVSKILPELFGLAESCMRKMNFLFTNNACEYITGYHGFWVLEYEEGGQFAAHCDWDSGPNGIRPPVVATACVLLNDDFEGGDTYVIGPDDETSVRVPRTPGDIVMWDGFTQHAVTPVTKGTRYVLVIHYTGSVR